MTNKTTQLRLTYKSIWWLSSFEEFPKYQSMKSWIFFLSFCHSFIKLKGNAELRSMLVEPTHRGCAAFSISCLDKSLLDNILSQLLCGVSRMRSIIHLVDFHRFESKWISDQEYVFIHGKYIVILYLFAHMSVCWREFYICLIRIQLATCAWIFPVSYPSKYFKKIFPH